MRKFLLALLIALLVPIALWADSDRHDTSIDEIIGRIYTSIDIEKGDQIDPELVAPTLLEALGDAVMGEVHPETELHEWMDEMMGGEGSESLAAAHRWMGYRYLTGGYGVGGEMMGFGTMGRGMMGSSMIGSGIDQWSMMGNPDIPRMGFSDPSPEQIVKERYARGEITREEYLQIMDDLSEEK